MNRNDLAREAILYSLPLYETARMQVASSPRKNTQGQFADPQGGPESTRRWANVFSHTRQLLNAKDRRVVTPNADTLYTSTWIDLSDGPLLLHTPDTGERYYVLGLLDAYTNPFAHLGTRSNGNAAHTFFLHGPNWQGTPPAGTLPIVCATPTVWLIGRILALPHEDMSPVHVLQDAFRLTTLQGEPAARIVTCGLQGQDQLGDAATFVEVVNRQLTINPPPPDETNDLARFSALGIGAGLDKAQADLPLLQQTLSEILSELDAPASSDLDGGWNASVEVTDHYGRDWFTRARVARCYIGLLGTQEVIYQMAHRDNHAQPLDGRHRYRLRFAPGGLPQVDAFWSLSLYSKSDYMFVDNPLQRHAIGDRTPGLCTDPDGGLTIWLGHTPPPQTSNWLPAPAEPFYVAIRLYLPRAVHQEGLYVYPVIELMDDNAQ
jgi:hypothetical protein